MTNGAASPRPSRWMPRATNSLPVPASPVMSTVAAYGATFSARRNTSCMARLRPTMPPKER